MNLFKYWWRVCYPQVGDVWTNQDKDHSPYRPMETYSDWAIKEIKGKHCLVDIRTHTYGYSDSPISKQEMDCTLWWATYGKWLRPESVR